MKIYKRNKNLESALAGLLLTCHRLRAAKDNDKAKAAVLSLVPIFVSAGMCYVMTYTYIYTSIHIQKNTHTYSDTDTYTHTYIYTHVISI